MFFFLLGHLGWMINPGVNQAKENVGQNIQFNKTQKSDDHVFDMDQ